jgi:hypothetical protein
MSDSDEVRVIRIANDQVLLPGHSAAWDDKNEQIVGMTVASTNQQSLEALWASLVTNSNKSIRVTIPGDRTYYLKNAKRGYFRKRMPLTKAHARGYVETIIHPAAGDPSKSPKNYFYVLPRGNEELLPLFKSRLSKAIVWPVLDEWLNYLLEKGLEVRAISHLNVFGPDFAKGGFAVLKDDETWDEIIQAGLTGGSISF